MTYNINLRQIEAFLAVADERHFGRAAERLSVSAPWMSHTIKDIERAMRVQLLTRTTRSVELTEAGQVFANLAGQVIADLAAAVRATQGVERRMHRALRLGYTIGAGLEIVPKLIRTFYDRNPDVTLESEEFDFTDPSAGLRDFQVHAAVVRPPLGLTGLVSVELATERRVVCLPDDHRLATRKWVEIADLLSEPIVAAPPSPGPWRDYWILSEYRTEAARIVDEAPTLDAELHLVSRGVGLSITSEAVGRWYRRPGVTFVPIRDLSPCIVSLAWWPQETASVALLAAIANEFRSSDDELARPRSVARSKANGAFAEGASVAPIRV
jgi:DNA-binding transcriptional LysR family regulator